MKWITVLLTYFFSNQSSPLGTYIGSKTVFGETVNAAINVKDTEKLDFSISGDFVLNCKDEYYSYADGKIVLDDLEIVGDCAHDALVDNQITLKDILFDQTLNQITVSVKYSIMTLDILMIPNDNAWIFMR